MNRLRAATARWLQHELDRDARWVRVISAVEPWHEQRRWARWGITVERHEFALHLGRLSLGWGSGL